VQLRVEEVDPEIPVHRDPQEPLAHADEGGRLQDCVRGEVVQLHAVVVAQPAHEAARRRHEATLVVADEADDVVVQRVGLPIRRQRDDPRRGLPVHIRRQLAAVLELVQRELRHRRAVPWQRIQHLDRLRGRHCNWR
jgi:hypothetical protein